MKTIVASIVALTFSTVTTAEQGASGTRETSPAGAQQQQRIAGPSSGSTNSAAKSGQATQLMGGAMSMATGGYLIKRGKADKEYWLVAMGVLSMSQGALQFGGARQSGRVGAATNVSWGDTDSGLPPWDPNNPNTWGPNGNPLTPEQRTQFNELRREGYQFNRNGTVTAPDGKLLKGEDFKSAEAMAAAGIPSDQIGGLQAALEEANKLAAAQVANSANAPNVVSMGIDGGAGGGRSPASYDGADSSFDDYLAKLRNPFGLTAQQKAQMVAGKTVSHGDDKIGVKVDDIFKMVHRRYQEKRADNEFIEAAPAVAPAAAPKVTTPRRGQ